MPDGQGDRIEFRPRAGAGRKPFGPREAEDREDFLEFTAAAMELLTPVVQALLALTLETRRVADALERRNGSEG